ncbi:MAG: hypothetical protein PWP15_1118 [Methanothermococcus sp.]|uniref:hypothetical protein n=1 Tax=Methanothermococcus sp. TaxID=2614238 RepID=UPI002586B094|nr:hypothetical protein [Methanothermococcus sp.]MDK2790611.1 hypothetical protein [Methanothermococcus sp.]
MIRVYINSRLQDIKDITITKKLPEISSLEPSRVSVIINNANNEYKTDPNTNDIINSYNEVIDKDTEIYIEKDVDNETKRVFTGWIDRPQLNIEKKTFQVQAHDWATILQKNKLDNRFYVNASFDTIIKDILPASMDKTGIYTINDTIDYVFFEDMKVGEAIEKLIKSVGGRFYFDEYNKPIFDGGYKYAEAQTTEEFTKTINDIRISSINQISHALQDESVDRVTVISETYKQQEKEDYIYIAENIACETDPYPVGDDQFVAEFDDPVYYVQPLSQVEIQTEDGITLDSAFWDSQFISGTSTPKNPKEMLLKFNGGGTKVVEGETVPQTVELLKIKGKFLRKETFVNTEGDQSEKANEKEYEPELVQNATWCNKLSQYLYREWHNRPTIQLTLSELQKAKEYKVGKKIQLYMDAEDIQNRMVIHEIVERYSLNTAKVKLKLKYDAGNSFVPDEKPEVVKRPSNQPNIPDIEEDIQTINQTLSDIAADNKLTSAEKKTVRTEWQRIQNEYTSLSNQATAYAITYSSYTTQYNALNTYLTGLNLTADTTEDIVRATFETKFDNYYVEKEALVKKIQDRIHDEGTKDFVGATDPNDNFSPLANGTIWHDTSTNTLKKWDTGTSSWVVLRSNYNIGNIKMQGDNLYAGTIKSNALLSDGTTPVSKINVDDGTFKFGDDVSTTKKYISYNGANLEIVGGTLKLKSESDSIQFLDSGFFLRDTSEYEAAWGHPNSVAFVEGDLNFYTSSGYKRGSLYYRTSPENGDIETTDELTFSMDTFRKVQWGDRTIYPYAQKGEYLTTKTMHLGDELRVMTNYAQKVDGYTDEELSEIIYSSGSSSYYYYDYNSGNLKRKYIDTSGIVGDIFSIRSSDLSCTEHDESSPNIDEHIYTIGTTGQSYIQPNIRGLQMVEKYNNQTQEKLDESIYLGRFTHSYGSLKTGLIIRNQKDILKRFEARESVKTGVFSTYIEIDLDTILQLDETSSKILKILNEDYLYQDYPIGTWSKTKYKQKEYNKVGEVVITNQYRLFFKTENTGGWIAT